MPIQHVALVGHCGFDSGSLARFAEEIAPNAKVSRVNDQASLDAIAKPDTLLLVNRVLDGRFAAGQSGTDLIRDLTKRDEAPPIMLISNYDDAQQAAVEAGALPGFGKSDLGDKQTRERVMQAIETL